MLAITAIIATVVLETIRISTQSAIRVERAARSSVDDALDILALRRCIASVKPDYRDAKAFFRGGRDGFTGRSETLIGLSGLSAGMFDLGIVARGPGVDLVYAEHAQRWTLLSWDRAEAAFAYFDAESGAWLDEWTSAQFAEGYFMPIPDAIRLTVRTPDETQAFIFRPAAEDVPPMRARDLILNRAASE